MEKNVFGQKLYYVDYTRTEIERMDRKKVVLVLPSGSIEEHGPHLTLASDATQAQDYARLAARQVKNAIILPALWYSTALDTSGYAGTVSMRPSVFVEMVVEIITSLYRNGFRKLVIGNVHGSAKTPLDVAIREFHARMGTPESHWSDDFFVLLHNCYMPATAYLNTFAEGKDWGHACEMETSVDLYMHPERVDMKKAVEEYIPWDKGFEWYIGNMSAVNRTGVHGDATKSTAAKGKKIVDAIVAAYADILKAMAAGRGKGKKARRR